MTDRELLELAAKAAGIEGFWVEGFGYRVETPSGHYFWNPLGDDGEAMRLAVGLGLVVDCSRPSAGEPYKRHAIWLDELMGNEELTRRAIVRVAAQIGKGAK